MSTLLSLLVGLLIGIPIGMVLLALWVDHQDKLDRDGQGGLLVPVRSEDGDVTFVEWEPER